MNCFGKRGIQSVGSDIAGDFRKVVFIREKLTFIESASVLYRSSSVTQNAYAARWLDEGASWFLFAVFH